MKTNRFWGLTLVGIVGVGRTAYTTQSKPKTDPAQERAATIARPFAKFALAVKTHADHEHFFVESDGMPAHKMMVGIEAWQQQVPLPQKYSGNNAWQFPLFPTPAKVPLSAKDHFFRGAIAIAANGVPIFNPIKNDGRTDTFLAGELDEFGGHSGQGDDYHYHVLPMHLQKQIGKNLPVAYALDGYPIFGLTEPDGSAAKDLDRFNGHTTKALGYHYHGSLTYPYLNGGFHGEVVEYEGQVHPQPRASSPRPPTRPLRGAKIVGFETVKPGSYSVTYLLAGETRNVKYTVDKDGGVTFEFVDGQGKSTKETYSGGDRWGGRGGRGGQGGGPRPDGLGPPPGPRKPWLVDHAKELDADRNGEVSKSELTDQCREAFKGYARETSAIEIATLQDRPTVRNAIGGFVKVHAKELDRDGNGSITETELIDSMMRMFDKQDRDGDGKLSGRELES